MGCGYGGGHWERIDAKWENIFRLFSLNIRRFGGLLSLPHPWSLYHRRVFIRQEMMPIRKQSAFGNLNTLWDRVPPHRPMHTDENLFISIANGNWELVPFLSRM